MEGDPPNRANREDRGDDVVERRSPQRFEIPFCGCPGGGMTLNPHHGKSNHFLKSFHEI